MLPIAEIADGRRVELQVLRQPAQDGAGVDEIALPQRGVAADDGVLTHDRAGADLHVAVDYGTGADLHVVGQAGIGGNGSGRVDLRHALTPVKAIFSGNRGRMVAETTPASQGRVRTSAGVLPCLRRRRTVQRVLEIGGRQVVDENRVVHHVVRPAPADTPSAGPAAASRTSPCRWRPVARRRRSGRIPPGLPGRRGRPSIGPSTCGPSGRGPRSRATSCRGP